jgi:predicted dehydrogenase
MYRLFNRGEDFVEQTKKQQDQSLLGRRQFLKGSAGGIAVASTLAGYTGKAAVAAPATMKDTKKGKPANEKFVIGVIGPGNLGKRWHMGAALLPNPRTEVGAVCDVDLTRANDAARLAMDKQGKRVNIYKDYRKLLEQKDLDAILISTPDHWHAIPAIDAMEAGYDVYCEKPLTLTVDEGKAMVETARRYNTVFQTGSQQRSDARFHQACELVRNNLIGELKRIDTVLHPVNSGSWQPVQTPPANLDWDLWLGPTPWKPYRPNEVHYEFRWFYDYSGGVMTDWGAHHNDIAQWANGTSRSGPVYVDGTKATFSETGPHTVALNFDVHYKYANGVDLYCHTDKQKYDDGTEFGNGVKFTGTKGWIFVSRHEIQASDPEILKYEFQPDDVRLYKSNHHHNNWLDCMVDRKKPICDVEIGHRSVSVCHIGNISMRLGRPLQWDPEKEQFVGDEEANRMLSRPMRAPWRL